MAAHPGYFAVLTAFFLLAGVFLPELYSAFGQPEPDFFVDEYIQDIRNSDGASSFGDLLNIIWSIFKMFTFTWGSIPVWFDLTILMMLRLVWLYLFIDLLAP